MARGAGEKAGGSDGWASGRASGWAGWLLARWNGRRRVEPRLALVERITLAPRQSLALIEAEGRRILVATSPEGGPAFYPLDEPANSRTNAGANGALHGRPRTSRGVSW
ncbi:MAG: flagellar biosynthetic protein FliO [Terracidiphilus sp.]|nr:flagellar biosynthetic protein FliO [Terracidiphilus sp.]